MTRNLFTVAAAALLAGSAFFASLEDAEARGAGRAGGVHRMGNSFRHASIARGGAVHRGLGVRASHVGRVQRGLQVSKGLQGGQTMRHGGNLRQLSQRNSPTLNRNLLSSRNTLPALNKQAGPSVRSANLTAGPQGRMYANMGNTNAPQQQARVYRDMGMGNTPQANTTPPANGGSNQPPNNGKLGPLANGGKSLPKDHLVNQGKIPIWISKPVDWGITRVVPVYGPVKTVYDAAQIKPKIEQTLENSALSQKLHEEAIKAAAEAARARAAQGGGVFQPTGLNDPSLMDP